IPSRIWVCSLRSSAPAGTSEFELTGTAELPLRRTDRRGNDPPTDGHWPLVVVPPTVGSLSNRTDGKSPRCYTDEDRTCRRDSLGRSAHGRIALQVEAHQRIRIGALILAVYHQVAAARRNVSAGLRRIGRAGSRFSPGSMMRLRTSERGG